ncbi:hypothetical protein B0H67DRAFT_129623 [Lasiosphaeris hirsuta]|uniref:Uncharacterized protein n=1 Tax=Lasiosphaeris hirsuta TaxID=260670 RepID=A0AA40B0G3_9PEZI|nr:hypothetical protein B0H67DRAFT_129623 [Lasiosphaeris hirsuta]
MPTLSTSVILVMHVCVFHLVACGLVSVCERRMCGRLGDSSRFIRSWVLGFHGRLPHTLFLLTEVPFAVPKGPDQAFSYWEHLHAFSILCSVDVPYH